MKSWLIGDCVCHESTTIISVGAQQHNAGRPVRVGELGDRDR